MSYREIIGNNGKIMDTYLPATLAGNLEDVLSIGNDGGNIGMTNTGPIGCSDITSPFGQINAFQTEIITDVDVDGLTIDNQFGPLKIKGAFAKGSMLVGDGFHTNSLTVGTNGQVLTAASGQTLGVEWTTIPPPTITAGNNIDVTGSTVALQSPLTADLTLGGVNMLAGTDPTLGPNSTTNATGITFQAGGVAGGPNMAVYANSGTTITDIVNNKNISIVGSGITNADTNVGTSTITNISTPIDVKINSLDNIGGGFQRSTLSNNLLLLEETNSGTPTLTETSNYGNCLCTYNYTDTVSGVSTTTNKQANGSQALSTNVYNGSGGLVNFNQLEADSSRARLRVSAETSVNPQNVASLEASTSNCTLRHVYGTGCTTEMVTINSGTNITSTGAITNICSQFTAQTNSNQFYSTTFGAINFSTSGNSRFQIPTGGDILINNVLGGTTTTQITQSANNTYFPALRLQNNGNSSTLNPVGLEMFLSKNPPLVGVNGDILSRISFQGKDNTGSKREFANIECVATQTSPSPGLGVDGAIDFNCSVNNAISPMMRINGADNEINMFKPLDMNGGNIIKTTGGNLTIETTSSSGPGLLTLNSLQSVLINAGGGSGLSLSTVNGIISLNSGAAGRINFTTLTATATPTHNVQFQATTNGVTSASYLKCQLAGVDIWIPYLTTDPTL